MNKIISVIYTEKRPPKKKYTIEIEVEFDKPYSKNEALDMISDKISPLLFKEDLRKLEVIE